MGRQSRHGISARGSDSTPGDENRVVWGPRDAAQAPHLRFAQDDIRTYAANFRAATFGTLPEGAKRWRSIRFRGDASGEGVGVLRLRSSIGFAVAATPLRMTGG